MDNEQSFTLPKGLTLVEPTNNFKLPKGLTLVKPEEEEEKEEVKVKESFTLPKGLSLVDTPKSEQVQTSFQMEDLDTNKDWLRSAATIYESEEGEKFKGSNKDLAAWYIGS